MQPTAQHLELEEVPEDAEVLVVVPRRAIAVLRVQELLDPLGAHGRLERLELQIREEARALVEAALVIPGGLSP